ncbi:hypothetical protein GALL_426020 [mine drainage metagenome]|uniref:Uncharacterized protein n=1 Tax=mine drainage metagenome TaxID=410659 RepID=A0A1J5Q6V4_9ZZZZ
MVARLAKLSQNFDFSAKLLFYGRIIYAANANPNHRFEGAGLSVRRRALILSGVGPLWRASD